MVGQSLGHYRILEKLGAGGMGEVYRAEDTTLKRQVALKVLPADLGSSLERLERFQREAEILAALDHPNIVTVFAVEQDKGVHFLTMQLVEGKRLSSLIPRGGMPLERIFEIAIPLADALAAAHEKGVIHRDLKPTNIMVTSEGRVKVLDFGLAKLKPEVEAAETSALPTEPLTEEGKILGTVPYMSPEQLEGRGIDSRSDIFSLGVILYEMATGERPFQGKSSASLIAAIMTGSPREMNGLRAELPHHLSRITRHCLEKDPRRRFQSARDTCNELEDLHREETSRQAAPTSPMPSRKLSKMRLWWPVLVVAVLSLIGFTVWLLLSQEPGEETIGAAEPESPMIVILPFESLGPPEEEYFADGLTEEITSQVASGSQLRVISRTSAMQYKRDRPLLKQIGEELGVDYVLEGTVRWEKEPGGTSRIRVTPQLIRVADDTNLWSERYDREFGAIFQLQSEIAQHVIDQLEITLLEPERQVMVQQPTADLEAYQAYLRGVYYSRKPDTSLENFELAVEHLEATIALDPSFALAYSELAKVHSRVIHFGHDTSDRRKDAAERAAERALALAPESPEVRYNIAHYYYSGCKDYSRALEELARAEKSSARRADVFYLKAAILRRQGRWEEAQELLEAAFELDPRNADLAVNLGANLYLMRRYEDSDRYFDHAITIQPDQAYAYYFKAWSHWARGELRESRRTLDAMAPTEDPRAYWSRYWQELYDAEYERAIKSLGDFPNEWIRTDRVAFPKSLLEGHALNLAGEPETGRKAFLAARALLLAEIEKSPQDHRLHSALGIAYATLGQKGAAIQEGERATELYPLSKDALVGAYILEDLAFIYALVGESEAALDQITALLSVPSRMSIALLKIDPRWNPLRDHPRFQALLEK